MDERRGASCPARLCRLAVLVACGLVPPLFALPAAALPADFLPAQYIYRQYQDELPQQSVRTLAQTPDGYLWLGTQAGLARFDGQLFDVFEPANTPALKSGDIMRLFLDREGRLWVASRGGGMAVVEAGQVRAFEPEGGKLPDVMMSMAETPDGARWFGSRDQGVFRSHKGRLKQFDTRQGLGSNAVYTLLTDSQGVLWAGCLSGGLSRWTEDRFEPVAPDLLGTDSVLALAEDSSGALWIGTRRSGVLRLDADRRRAPEVVAGTTGVVIMALWADREGGILAGTQGRGLLRLRGERIEQFDKSTGLSEDKVVSLLEDREGSLWVGTDSAGLNQVRPGSFRTFGPPEGLRTTTVRAVAQGSDGTVWMGTDDSGLGALSGDRLRHLTESDGLASSSVTALLPARDGSLWLGVRPVGLQHLRPDGRWETYDRSRGLSSDIVLSLAEAADGSPWVGTLDRGVLRLRDGSFEPVEDPELTQARIWLLVVGEAGELYIGTDGRGLRVLSPGQSLTQPVGTGLEKASISSLALGEDHSLWVGTYGQGLAHIENGHTRLLTRQQGLPDDTVLQLLDDGLGALWMSSNKGVFRLPKDELLAVLAGRSPRLEARGFGKTDGMRSAECNGAVQPAGWKGKDGRLWFPTVAGLVVVDPARLVVNSLPPPVILEEVRVGGELKTTAVEGTFPPGSNRYEFHYTAPSFVDPSRVRFRYRMEGYDPEWVEVGGNERRAIYTSLPTGRRYRFRVIAANNDGIWNETGASFAFVVEPYFWQRPSFLLFAAALAAALAWGLYQLRVQHLVRRTEQLEKLVADRTAEVVAQRDQLEDANAELTRLNQFKSEFLGIAAHDLKNPLSVIYGYAGLMISKSGEDPALLRVARRISASANQMLTIVSDLLDTTAMESGKLRFERERTDLSELVATVLESQRVMAADRQIDLQLHAAGAVFATIDREKITRVVQNLTSNAIRYSKAGTPVEVFVETTGAAPDLKAKIAVRDQGPGLSPEQVARIFERFERLAAKHQVTAASTGLGLSIVKQFVELHEGRIWVESEPGNGSTFLVELPAA